MLLLNKMRSSVHISCFSLTCFGGVGPGCRDVLLPFVFFHFFFYVLKSADFITFHTAIQDMLWKNGAIRKHD